MMEICEVIDEFTDDTSSVFMQDFVNKNLDEIHRDITDHDIETDRYAKKMAV